MRGLVVTPIPVDEPAVEIVERKGVGHPDSLCDGLAEGLSRVLCHTYRERYGQILHHNVDKALLCAGRAVPAFGGGRVETPIDIYLAGRATSELGGQTIPLADLAVDAAERWLGQTLRALDPRRHVRIHPVLRPGSMAMQDLFSRAEALANDTSIGVGYAPLSRLETLVLALDRAIADRRPVTAWGEDLKVMAVRMGEAVELTLSCAMIDRTLSGVDDYRAATAALEDLALEVARNAGFEACNVAVNAADRPKSLYLTVTGTSAESADDGQVGRGNRINGLITPSRPMSLEAAAGKNPVTHVGKIYNVACAEIAQEIVDSFPQVVSAQCVMVSRIGRPISEPALVELKIAAYHPGAATGLRHQFEGIVDAALARLPARTDDFVSGRIGLF